MALLPNSPSRDAHTARRRGRLIMITSFMSIPWAFPVDDVYAEKRLPLMLERADAQSFDDFATRHERERPRRHFCHCHELPPTSDESYFTGELATYAPALYGFRAAMPPDDARRLGPPPAAMPERRKTSRSLDYFAMLLMLKMNKEGFTARPRPLGD